MNEISTKFCKKCNQEKPVTEFWKETLRKGGYRHYCKECCTSIDKKRYITNRKEILDAIKFRLYKITPDGYDELYKQQNGCCKLCGKHQSELKRALDVDHNHKTGEIRGLLCITCNRAIGYLYDDAELCLSAYNYLRKN
jgi:hypothetical protein